MSLKSKLTGLENRLGVSRCPQCGVTASRRDGLVVADDVAKWTARERGEFVMRFLFRVFNQAELLNLLAVWDPLQRQSIAHVYPLPDDAQVRDDTAVPVANSDVAPLDD